MGVDRTEDQQELSNRLNAVFERVVNQSYEDLKSRLEENPLFVRNADNILDTVLMQWQQLQLVAHSIATAPNFVFLKNLGDVKRFIFSWSLVENDLLSHIDIDPLLLNHNLSAACDAIKKIALNLRSVREFTFGSTECFNHKLAPEHSEARIEFERFKRVGRKIRLEPNYRTNNTGKFESLLKEFDAGCLDLQPAQERMSKIKYASETAFVALAAPSMEGKSQSAFVMKQVLPLYFPLSEAAVGSEAYKSQPIYRNFTDYVKLLRDCSMKDLEELCHTLPSAQELLDNKKTKPLWTLGFFKSLMNTFSPYLPTNPGGLESLDWMGIFTEERTFSFSQVSVEEIIQHPNISKFFLFLDEFVTEPWSVLIRNLARAIGLRCVVANTNTKIANIVGKFTASGANGQKIWSVVICRLNGASKTILESEFGLKESFVKIIRHRYPGSGAAGRALETADDHALWAFLKSNKDPVLRFLGTFDHGQFESLRPGIAAYLAQAFKEFGEEHLNVAVRNFTLGYIIDAVVGKVFALMISRKPKIVIEPSAILGKIGLLLAQSYVPLTDETLMGANANELATAFNQRAHLENHLYYLSNPTKSGQWAFLTFVAVEHSRNIIKYASVHNTTKEWKCEYTYFRHEEIMTILACFSVRYTQTISRVLSDANLRVIALADYNYNAPNENAPSLNGNALEVTAAACVSESTHRDHSGRVSISGVRGDEFIRNLVRNLIFVDNFDAFTPVTIEYSISDYNLKGFLENCRFPFLYGWNHENAYLQSLNKFLSTNNIIDQEIFTSSFLREANKAEVDGCFDVMINGEVKTAVVECKNHGSAITCPNLTAILERCLNTTSAGLSLVFGTFFSAHSEEKPVRPVKHASKLDAVQEDVELLKDLNSPLNQEDIDMASKFREFCETNGINVFRVIAARPLNQMLRGPVYRIIPFEPKFDIKATNLNCFLFEQTYINSLRDWKAKY